MRTYIDNTRSHNLGADFFERFGQGVAATALDRIQPQIASATEKVLNSKEMQDKLIQSSQVAFRQNMNAILTTVAAVVVFGVGAWMLVRK